MKDDILSRLAVTLKLPIFIFLVFFKGCFCLNASYEGCASKNCGDGVNVSFPFYIQGLQDPKCAYPGYKLDCSNNGSLVLQTSSNNYSVQDIDYDAQTIRLLNPPTFTSITCPSALRNFTLDYNLFRLYDSSGIAFLMNCSKQVPKNLKRYRIGYCGQLVMLVNDSNLGIGKKVCTRVVLAYGRLYSEEYQSFVVHGGNYADVLMRGFTLSWVSLESCETCKQSGGRCGYETRFMCFCPNLTGTRVRCSIEKNKKPSTLVYKEPETNVENKIFNKKRMILLTGVATGVVMILVVIILSFIRKLKQRNKKKNNLNVENFLKNHEFLAPKRYSYSQVKKMTNSFNSKLGQGGFGSVYRGDLSNGNLVAVKVLSEVKGNGEDFINEVASVGRTSHVNIVTLVGFCCDGHQRALIYEFMPNGSLEKFIYSHDSSCNTQLGWEKLHQIAIGIARGLEYPHSGCNTRILHFDIKPHNILLDQDFCPKISDFGLAKLFVEKKSMISMSHMRGTPGYIAPELFSRNFGQVSHKSDVYSNGMMILEMVGGRKNIEVEVDHTSEIYFPHWIYKKIETNEEQLGLHGIMREDENEMARKMIIVGLWCIQTSPMNRPKITRVLEMLDGDVALLEIPPKPYLSSPTRSGGSSSTDSD